MLGYLVKGNICIQYQGKRIQEFAFNIAFKKTHSRIIIMINNDDNLISGNNTIISNNDIINNRY
jgi:hypothetical protein